MRVRGHRVGVRVDVYDVGVSTCAVRVISKRVLVTFVGMHMTVGVRVSPKAMGVSHSVIVISRSKGVMGFDGKGVRMTAICSCGSGSAFASVSSSCVACISRNSMCMGIKTMIVRNTR